MNQAEMQGKWRTFRADSLEIAYENAAEFFGVTPEELVYDVLLTERRGFLGFGRRPAVIEATVKAIPVEEPLVPDADGSVAGTVGIVDGRLVFTPPVENGRFPTITPGPGIRLMLNGKEVKGTEVVFDDADLEVVTDSVEPVTSLETTTSQEGLQGLLTVVVAPGRRYTMVDHEPVEDLEIRAEDETIPAQEPTLEQATEALQEAGIVYGTDEELVRTALADRSGEPQLVAQGTPGSPPKDDEIEYLFEKTPQQDQQRPAMTYPSVKPGTVLAVLHPGHEGTPGTDVSGEPLPVPARKVKELQVGNGVRIIQDGTRAIAVSSGRPALHQGRVVIFPVQVIDGDADVVQSPIEFHGDIVISGNVTDSASIQADGNVYVAGFVSSATIQTEGSVSVVGTIVRSQISAGGEVSAYAAIIPYLDHLRDALRDIAEKGNAIADPGDRGEAIRDMLVTTEGSGLRQTMNDLDGLVESLSPRVRGEWKDWAAELKEAITSIRQGSGNDPAPLQTLADQLDQYLVAAVTEFQEGMDVVAGFIQNSTVSTTGSVRVTNRGCYNSTISAGQDVVISGPRSQISGGVTVARSKVVAEELGSPGGARTMVSVREGGEIKAALIHPETILRTGSVERRTRRERPQGRATGADGGFRKRRGNDPAGSRRRR